MVKIKTELEQKIELMDSLENVKNVVNEAGGNITEDTPYLQYGEKVLEVIGGGSSQKGSFDSTTQQLTLNYDYLVEKINSSDQLTAETKELIISRLNNSDVVVDMTRDTISTTGHPSDIAWACSDGDPTSENPDEFPTTMIFVSKSNPETSKLIIPADSGGVVFGSYNAMRALYEMQGQSLTAEEVEALLSSSVVDEEVLTISGTLGNFSVEFN